MANKMSIPLVVENKDETQEITSEIMLTTRNKQQITKYDSIKEGKKVLLPGDQMMTRDEVPSYHCGVYVAFYLFMFVAPIPLSWLAYEYVDDPEPYLAEKYGALIFTLLFGWFIGAVFRNMCGMPSNYTRKIGHIWGFLGQYLFIILADEDSALSGGSGSDTFENIIMDTVWAAWTTETFIFVMAKPTRRCSDWICGDTSSDRCCRWFNCCTQTMDAFERSEDRPNHLLWLNAQFILYYFFLFLMSFWWDELDSGVQVLVPAIISGLGDGLAEPVGVKFGRTCCCLNWDNTYRTHGCCTKYDYVRSVAGSSMVWLSGYLAVASAYSDYTLWQFIIALIVIPPIGTFVEAKAPHTMDNPFIALIVGVAATSILYIPLDDEGISRTS